jgi:hypothetical protein
MMSDIEQGTLAGVGQEPASRSEEDRELAGRLVADTNDVCIVVCDSHFAERLRLI